MKKKVICILMAVVLLSSCSNDTTTVTATIESSKTPTTSITTATALTTVVDETQSEITTLVEIADPDIRSLKWGMLVDEVKYYEKEKNYTESVEDTGAEIQTLLVYPDVLFDGYNTEMTLCIVEGKGLNGVNYRIKDDKYQEIYNKVYNEYGEPDSTFTDYSYWEIEKDNVNILVMKYELTEVITQYSFFPNESITVSTETAETTKSEKTTTKPKANTPHNPTIGEKNALKTAYSYLNYTAFSYIGLIDQLEYEGYTHSEAVYAVDNCGANWNEQALLSAYSYLDYTAFSYSGLIDQLEYEGFTNSEATYAVKNCGADWYEQAAKCAKSYLDYSSFSRSSLIDQLEYEGFTYDQAVYGVEANGY